MDLNSLSAALGRDAPAEYLEPVNQALIQSGCTTVQRAAAWLAQIGHESGGLYYWEEIASGAAYEGRTDLGNVRPGDGRRFKGRGPIQITGRHNYSRLSQWAFDQGIINTPGLFVERPELLATTQYGLLGAVWYWTVARPQMNDLADRGEITNISYLVNGGWNGLDDRRKRYFNALKLGERILPVERKKMEKILDYPRDQVRQDTGYFCGPATCQTIIRAHTGHLIPEAQLAQELGTTWNGTDYIGYLTRVLTNRLGVPYETVLMPNDPPTGQQQEQLWQHLQQSINAGYGVAVNIVAPPSNYPRGVYGSVSPRYGGGTVYHYIAAMGYRDGEQGRAVWIADSGFSPYGYWISLDQLASLIPPKGYSFANVSVSIPEEEDMQFDKIQDRYPSRVTGADPAVTLTPLDAVMNSDANSWEANRKLDAVLAELQKLREEVNTIKEGK